MDLGTLILGSSQLGLRFAINGIVYKTTFQQHGLLRGHGCGRAHTFFQLF